MIGLSLSLIMADCCQLSKLTVFVNFGNENGLDAEICAISDGSICDGCVDVW